MFLRCLGALWGCPSDNMIYQSCAAPQQTEIKEIIQYLLRQRRKGHGDKRMYKKCLSLCPDFLAVVSALLGQQIHITIPLSTQ